jgi:lysophospholipase L1-like esterase
MINVLAIGDSLTDFGFHENGWATLINRSNPHITFQNIGVPCITSSEMVQTLPCRINVEQIRDAQIVTLLLGTNDTLHYYENPISLLEFSNNLCAIISYLKSISPFLRIILIGPPISIYSLNECVSAEKSLMYKFNRAVLTLAKKLNFVFIDLMDNTDGNEILVEDLYDGIHMNDKGHAKMVSKLIKHLT